MPDCIGLRAGRVPIPIAPENILFRLHDEDWYPDEHKLQPKD